MGAEWNRFIDNVGVRVALIAIGMVVWAGAVVGLLAA
jgi:hypothetical protein